MSQAATSTVDGRHKKVAARRFLRIVLRMRRPGPTSLISLAELRAASESPPNLLLMERDSSTLLHYVQPFVRPEDGTAAIIDHVTECLALSATHAASEYNGPTTHKRSRLRYNSLSPKATQALAYDDWQRNRRRYYPSAARAADDVLVLEVCRRCGNVACCTVLAFLPGAMLANADALLI